MNTKWGGFVDNLDEFDARFWGITPREALADGSPATVAAGSRLGSDRRCRRRSQSICAAKRRRLRRYFDARLFGDPGRVGLLSDAHTNSGITMSIAANRISYLLDLKGPSLAVDTACSSSLVALSIAVRSIWAGNVTRRWSAA